MRIRLHRVSNGSHDLEIVRADGSRERVALETRSTLVHDLLHYAVETEAELEVGFWGSLAAGRRLTVTTEMSTPQLAEIERIVGAMSGAVKGRTAREMADGFVRYAEMLDWDLPPWLDERFVAAVQERMRQLQGRWKATPFGGAMELDWPARTRV
jgi:hypothetical protein